MRTKEIVNGYPVTIDWEFEERQDEIRPHWYQWYVTGNEKLGSRKFIGNCEGDETEPENLHDVQVTNIEYVEYDLPLNKSYY